MNQRRQGGEKVKAWICRFFVEKKQDSTTILQRLERNLTYVCVMRWRLATLKRQEKRGRPRPVTGRETFATGAVWMRSTV